MDTDNQAFLAAIAANPYDNAPRLVYADWLDEQGEADKAEYVRLVVQMRDDVQAQEPLKRMIEVAKTIPEDWRMAVGGCFELHFDTGDAKGMMRAVFEALTFFAPKKPESPEPEPPTSFCVVRQITRELAESMLQQHGLAGLTRFRLFIKVSHSEPPPSAFQPITMRL